MFFAYVHKPPLTAGLSNREFHEQASYHLPEQPPFALGRFQAQPPLPCPSPLSTVLHRLWGSRTYE